MLGVAFSYQTSSAFRNNELRNAVPGGVCQIEIVVRRHQECRGSFGSTAVDAALHQRFDTDADVWDMHASDAGPGGGWLKSCSRLDRNDLLILHAAKQIE
jgi:hypothetical protein